MWKVLILIKTSLKINEVLTKAEGKFFTYFFYAFFTILVKVKTKTR